VSFDPTHVRRVLATDDLPQHKEALSSALTEIGRLRESRRMHQRRMLDLYTMVGDLLGKPSRALRAMIRHRFEQLGDEPIRKSF